jgi:2-polyprenyl-3-methyl-5-hydroxy-6-metoxy-1,4-benzoquinol methylase
MKYNDKCKSCSLQVFNSFLDVLDHTVSRETFSIVKCNSCGFVSTQFETESDLGYFYDSPEYISHTNSSRGFMNSVYQVVRSYTLKGKLNLLKRYCQRLDSLFDYGCGTGHFLNYSKRSSLDVFGIEPSESARAIALDSGLNVSVGINEFNESVPRETFDAITLWHVLEHIPDLNETITFLKSKMHVETVLFVAVPNHTSLDAKHYKTHWAAYDVPRHLYHYSPDSIKQLMQNHQLEMIDMKPMWFDSFYVSMLSEKYKTGRINYIKAFWNGFRSNLNAFFNKGECSSQIYIFKKIK